MKDDGATRETRCRGRLPRPTGRRGRAATESEGLVLPWKPGNAGGGRSPGSGCLYGSGGSGRLACALQPHQPIRTLQRKLYVKAKTEPTFRFYRLYDKVYRADILAHAYALAKANGGAPGVDGETFEQIESAGRADWLARLREDLRTRRYQPAAVRRVYIPKAGGVGSVAGDSDHPRPRRTDGGGADAVAHLRGGLHRRDVRIPAANAARSKRWLRCMRR